MAAITVGPNETFSHIHNVDTFTELKGVKVNKVIERV